MKLRRALIPMAALGCLAPSVPALAAVPEQAKQPPAKPGYAEIYEKNVFDPQRQPWVEKPPVAAVPALNPNDVELYGVTAYGSYKRAVVKLGPVFKAPPGSPPKQFVTLAEGQSIGPYTLVEIGPKGVVFEAGGARYPIAFTAKKDRPQLAAPAPMQAPVVLPAATPTAVTGLAPIITAQPAPSAPQPASEPVADQQPQTQQKAETQKTAEAQKEEAPQPGPQIQGRTLLEAIEMARQAQARGEIQNIPKNPFTK